MSEGLPEISDSGYADSPDAELADTRPCVDHWHCWEEEAMNAAPIALMGRRHVVMGLGALAAIPIASIHACTVLAAGRDKAGFIEAAMDEVVESQRRLREDLDKQGIQPALAKPPRIIPFGDWDFFYIDSALYWEPNGPQEFKPVVVPRGFVSDLASIPQAFWSVMPKTGRYAYAAFVHDYLYWVQADRIFKIAMEDSKVPSATIQTMFNAVRMGGQSAWENNARLKAAGEKRILKRFPPDPLISWSDWGSQPDVFGD